MNLPRWDFDAVVCNGAVYAIGGGTLAIERIKIEDLLKQHTTSMPGKTTESWCNLKCQLPVRPSHAGSTAVLKDRYIVVMTFGSRVRMQVLDTRDPDNHTLTLSRASYPNLVQRIGFTTIAVENRMYILGGKATSNYKALKLVECIEFATNDSANDPNKHVPGGESSCRILRPEFLSWKVETDLCLPHARYHHQAVVVGSKIVVAGGWDLNGKCAGSVEVVDVGQGETSELTKLNKPNNVNALLALPDSGRLLAVDTIFGTLETLQFGGDQENLETTRQGTIPKVRRPVSEITSLQTIFLMFIVSVIRKSASPLNSEVLEQESSVLLNHSKSHWMERPRNASRRHQKPTPRSQSTIIQSIETMTMTKSYVRLHVVHRGANNRQACMAV